MVEMVQSDDAIKSIESSQFCFDEQNPATCHMDNLVATTTYDPQHYCYELYNNKN